MDRQMLRILALAVALGGVTAYTIRCLQVRQSPPNPAPDNTWNYEPEHAPEPGPGVDIGPEFSIGFVHTRGDFACHQVAFYLRPAYPAWQAENARMPDGSEPAKGSPMRCGSCGRFVMLSEVELRPRRKP